MSPNGSKWRLDTPLEAADPVPARPDRTPPAAPIPAPGPMCRIFQPDGYEPRYPYPLLVLFHPHGSNEERVLELVPQLSRRNFVAVSIRGPQMLGVGPDGQLACGWGHDDFHADLIQEHIFRAVESVRRSYHVHTERVFAVGVCEGAAAAYRAAFGLADRIGGVVALNGSMPRATGGAPLFRPNALRGLPVFIGHGVANADHPFQAAAKDYKLLYAAGADVLLNRYTTNHRLNDEMLRDVNRWVIRQVEGAGSRFTKSG